MKDPQGMFSRFGVSGLRLWGVTLNPEKMVGLGWEV